jgi:hypothetical protein
MKLDVVSRVENKPHDSAEMVLRYPKENPDGTSFSHDTRGQARIVGVDSGVYDPDLELPFELGGYAAIKNCCDYEGAGPRTYQLMVTQYGSSEPITPIVEEPFGPKPDFRQVIYTVDWVESDDEEPPEPEPPDDVNEEVRQIGLRMQQDGARLVELANSTIAHPTKMTLTMGDGSTITYQLSAPTGGMLAAIRRFFKI